MKVIERKIKEKRAPAPKRVKITRCKLTKNQQQRMIELFVLGMTARSAADMMALQVNTAALFYRKIREVLAYNLAQDAKRIFHGEFILDVSNFGTDPTTKSDKHVVFGIVSREGKIFTRMAGQDPLTSIAANIIKADSAIFVNIHQASQALDVNDCYQERINLAGISDYTIGTNEEFWEQAKQVLRKYNGIPKSTFPLFLKECEFRFNYGSPKAQLKTLKLWTGL